MVEKVDTGLNYALRPRAYTITKHAWCNSARDGLRDTFYGHETMIRKGVQSGQMELFRVNGDSWLVTERMGGMLFVWCYQGRGLVQLIEKLCIVCRHQTPPLSQISFFTRRLAAVRALRRFNPTALPTQVQGETQYIIEVKP